MSIVVSSHVRLKNDPARSGMVEDVIERPIPNRLIVAYGLSFSALEIPDWYTPDQHLPIEQVKELEFTTSYIGPEQV